MRKERDEEVAQLKKQLHEAQLENEILKRSRRLHTADPLHASKAMGFEFIDKHREAYPIMLMCRVLDVSRSGYYAWRKRETSEREMANEKLFGLIKTIYQQSKER